MEKSTIHLLNTSFKKILLVLLVCVSIFMLLRLPSLIEPYWYGDEGIYQVIGMAMQDGRLLYKEIWDNKPPLLYLLYAIVNGDLFFARLLSLFSGLGAVVTFFFLAKKLFSNAFSICISTILFTLLFATPYLEGNIANAENFMIFPILLALYFVIQKQNETKSYILSGLLLSAAFLIKIVGLFDFLAFFIIVAVLRYYTTNGFGEVSIHVIGAIHQKKLLKTFKNELIFITSFISPIVVVSFYFVFAGAFGDYIKAVFLQNIGYVGYGNTTFFPMSLLIFKCMLLMSALGGLFFFRNRLTRPELIIFIWLAFSLFSTYFSQRPYTHYLLMSLSSICLFVGLIFENKKKSFIYGAVFLALLILIYNTFSPYKKIFPYYNNYIDFLFNKKDVIAYQRFFDRITPRDYALAQFIQSKTTREEYVFLWSDSGQIYALSDKLPPGRYIVAYHITFYPSGIEETKKSIDDKKPKYIIETKKNSELDKLLESYTFAYMIEGARIYERND